MNNDPDRDDISFDFLKKIKNKLFSDEPVTKGELIQIIFVIILAIIIIIAASTTKCSLDCNMCIDAGQQLIQRGF